MTESWPPDNGVPTKDKMIPGDQLKWGQTPFDNLSRAELLRLVQAYHAAVTSANSVLHILRGNDRSPFWGKSGSGGRALVKTEFLLWLAGANDRDEKSENIYRCFFRYANVLLFGNNLAEEFDRWGIDSKGVMTAPYDNGSRPIEWRDLLPKT